MEFQVPTHTGHSRGANFVLPPLHLPPPGFAPYQQLPPGVAYHQQQSKERVSQPVQPAIDVIPPAARPKPLILSSSYPGPPTKTPAYAPTTDLDASGQPSAKVRKPYNAPFGTSLSSEVTLQVRQVDDGLESWSEVGCFQALSMLHDSCLSCFSA